MKINEGMRAGDLSGLVLPLLSVDEYESNVDKEAVAVGFYVHDKDAANDLNRFIQKSAIAILSSEVSPAPDQHGYFMVFVDFMDDSRIAKNLQAILKEIEPLCEVDNWKVRYRKVKEIIPFSLESFAENLKRIRKTDEDSVLEFLTPSDLGGVQLHEGKLTLRSGYGSVQLFEYVDYGTLDDMIKRHNLHEQSMGMNLVQLVQCGRLSTILGEGWDATNVGNLMILQYSTSDNCLVLRTIS